MPRKGKQLGRVGDYWLTKRPNSPHWHRTWYDAKRGQTRRQSLGLENFEEAQQALIQWIAHYVLMRKAAPRDVKLADVCSRYWIDHAVKRRSAPSIRRGLEIIVETLDADITVGEFGPRTQQRLVDDLVRRYPAGSGYPRKVFGMAKAAVLWAWRSELIEQHPPFIAGPAEGEPRQRILTVEELALLWDAAEWPHLQAYLMTLICTLCRPNTALELSRVPCDLQRGIIDLNPSGRERTKKRRPVIPMAEAFRPWVIAAGGHIVEYKGRPCREVKGAFRRAVRRRPR